MVLPAGSSIPPLPHAVVLIVAVAIVAWALARAGVTVSDRTVLALAPWMVLGATLYVVYQLDAIPAAAAPFFASPAVYGTTFVLAGSVWLAVQGTARWASILGGVGTLATLVPIAIALQIGRSAGFLAPLAPLAGVGIAAVLAWATWLVFTRARPDDAAAVGLAGPVVVFGHALDAVSTGIGIDLLGFAERTPLSRIIMEVAAALPTADVIGVGWLFVLVKLAVALVVLAIFGDFVREDPRDGFALLTVVAGVGLGPGAHNVLLFVVVGPTAF